MVEVVQQGRHALSLPTSSVASGPNWLTYSADWLLDRVKGSPPHQVHFGVEQSTGRGYLVIPRTFTKLVSGFTTAQQVNDFLQSQNLVLYSVGRVGGTDFQSLSPTGGPLQNLPGYRVRP